MKNFKLCVLTFLVGVASLANASSSFLTQEVKEDVLSFNNEYVQTFSCADLVGKIENITVSMTRTSIFSANWRGELTANGVIAPVYTSTNTEILGPRNIPTDLTFYFNSVDVENNLCINGASRVLFKVIPDATDQNLTARINGGLDNPYPNGYFSFNNTNQSDIYFIIEMSGENNSKPALETILNQSVSEGNTLQLSVTGSDVDNDVLTYSASNLPNGATFNPSTQIFTWTPDYDDAGTYEVTFTVTDNGNPSLSDNETVTLVVENTNRAPVLTPVGNQMVDEGNLLTLTLSATDPDGDTLTYSAANLPPGATFDPNTQTFSWSPSYSQSGNYDNIEFTVMDSGSPMELDVELITITVGDINRAPQISNPGPQEVLEADTLSFNVSAIDPDGDGVTITGSNFPAGATFDNGMFSWTPTLAQEGVYTVSFVATDTGAPNESSVTDVVITVGNNPTPTEQAEDLIDTVVTIDIPQNVENSYLANLQKVKQFILDGKIQAALNQLQAFINKVNQDYQQGILSQEEKEDLIDAANELIDDLSD